MRLVRRKNFVKYLQKSEQGILRRKDVYGTSGDRKSCRKITYGWVLAGILLILGILSRADSVQDSRIGADILSNADKHENILRGSNVPVENISQENVPQENVPQEYVNQGEEQTEKTAKLSGSLRLAGSSSMERMADMLAEGFMEKYPNVTVTIEYVGSAAGIEAVLNGSADIGNSSRKLKEEELARGAVENVIGMDKIAVCVDRANRITGLTREQLADIYTGKITNWSELGGVDLPIVVVGHEAGSGTRESFEELLGIKDRCVYANELNSMGAVKARAAVIPGVIGYLSCEVLDDSVKVLLLDGINPADSAEDGNYPLCRPFIMAAKGEISEQNELVQAWFAYVYQVRDGEGEW